jgi:hypothetical protein
LIHRIVRETLVARHKNGLRQYYHSLIRKLVSMAGEMYDARVVQTGRREHSTVFSDFLKDSAPAAVVPCVETKRRTLSGEKNP